MINKANTRTAMGTRTKLEKSNTTSKTGDAKKRSRQMTQREINAADHLPATKRTTTTSRSRYGLHQYRIFSDSPPLFPDRPRKSRFRCDLGHHNTHQTSSYPAGTSEVNLCPPRPRPPRPRLGDALRRPHLGFRMGRDLVCRGRHTTFHLLGSG